MLPHASAQAGRNSRGKKKPPNPAEGWEDSFVWHLCRCWEGSSGCGRGSSRHSCLPEGTSFRGTAGRTGPFSQAGAPELEQSLSSCFATLLHVLNPPALTCGLGISSVLPVCPGRAKLHPGSSQHCHRQPRQQEREQQHCWWLLPQLPEHPPQTKPTQSILKFPCRRQAGQRCGQQECREDERQLLCWPM